MSLNPTHQTLLVAYMYALALLLYRMPQELSSLLRDLIPELILSQKRHIHTHGSDSQRFRSYKFLKYSK